MTTPRRPARNQALPEELAQELALRSNDALYDYCLTLYAEGWTLQSIGAALDPPRRRSTVQAWVQKAGMTTPPPPPPPKPVLKTATRYVPKKASPGISSADFDRITALAPIARRYRSVMAPGHAAALANTELTEICQDLWHGGVGIQELASASAVTYRAMARRVKG